MKLIAALISIYATLVMSAASLAAENPRYLNWLTVSDTAELERTWRGSLVFLPDEFGRQPVSLLAVPGKLEAALRAVIGKQQIPTILYLHACEGNGHHRDDLRRFARLGFVVISLNSFARNYRPLGCYEEREKYLPSFGLAAAFQKAELDFAVQKLAEFDWIDRKNLFLIGSGMGGMVAAHYAGGAFAGHVIEGWGCRGPNPIFDGIWSAENVRIFSTISRNDPWFAKNPGFAIDCATFVKDRPGSLAILLDRPAHYVSWYPKSLPSLIRLPTRDMAVDSEALVADEPTVLQNSATAIQLKIKWTEEAVYARAVSHCRLSAKNSRLISEPANGIYDFSCDD